MSENIDDEKVQPDETHPADKLLGADWAPPGRTLQERQWDALDPERREHLEALKRETSEQGQPAWIECKEDDPDEPGWTRLVLRRADPNDPFRPDPNDPSPGELIGGWFTKEETAAEERAQAIVEEYRED
jgi:hypothetical protein